MESLELGSLSRSVRAQLGLEDREMTSRGMDGVRGGVARREQQGAAHGVAARRLVCPDLLCQRVRQVLEGVDRAVMAGGDLAGRRELRSQGLGLVADRGFEELDGRLARLRSRYPGLRVEEGPLLSKIRRWRKEEAE